MVFFVIELRTRAVHIAGIRVNPDGAWMMQVARNLVDPRGRFSSRCDSPDSRSRSTIHDGVGRTTQDRRSDISANSGEQPKLQPSCRKVREDSPDRASKSVRQRVMENRTSDSAGFVLNSRASRFVADEDTPRQLRMGYPYVAWTNDARPSSRLGSAVKAIGRGLHRPRVTSGH